MDNSFLSQEEIDNLLRNDKTADVGQELLNDMEKDALGEIGNISMGSAATTLSILLGKRVSITTPKVMIGTINDIRQQYPMPYLVIEVAYTKGLLGTNFFAISEKDALIISDLMMGRDGTAPPTKLTDMHMSAVTEAMNQMMGSTSTSMSTIFNKTIDIAPPSVNIVDFAQPQDVGSSIPQDEPVVRVSFRMEVEDLIDSEIMQIITLSVAREMVGNILGSMAEPAPKAPVQEVVETKPPIHTADSTHSVAHSTVPVQQVAVQPVHFAPLKQSGMTGNDANISFLMDVPLQLTVELGRTRKLIRDILELTQGSVVELDKLAGEAVDILVNGKLIAKGEVVVIDEHFGVRLTDIVSPMERTKNLQ